MFLFYSVYFVFVCGKQKSGVKRCLSLKKVENLSSRLGTLGLKHWFVTWHHKLQVNEFLCNCLVWKKVSKKCLPRSGENQTQVLSHRSHVCYECATNNFCLISLSWKAWKLPWIKSLWQRKIFWRYFKNGILKVCRIEPWRKTGRWSKCLGFGRFPIFQLSLNKQNNTKNMGYVKIMGTQKRFTRMDGQLSSNILIIWF